MSLLICYPYSFILQQFYLIHSIGKQLQVTFVEIFMYTFDLVFQ